MRMFNVNFLGLMCVVLLSSQVLWARQNAVSQFNQKIKAEASVTSKLSQALVKQLDSKFFDVRAQVDLAPISSEIKNVQITLDLSPKLTHAYRTQLTKWLQQWTETTYGVRGQARVGIINDQGIVQSVVPVQSDLFFLVGLLVMVSFQLVRVIQKSRPPVQLCFGFIEGKIRTNFEVDPIPMEEAYIVAAEQLELIEIAEVIEVLTLEPVVAVEPFVESSIEEQIVEIVSPYAFIENLNNEQLKKLFFCFDLPQQVAFLMKAPRLSVQRLTNILDKQVVAKILSESALVQEASDEELQMQMQLWQEVQNNQMPEVEIPVSDKNEKFLRLKDVWIELPRKDRALLLEQMGQERPELVSLFLEGREEINSLKFWSVEKLRKFCLQMRSRELAAAIKVLPFLSPVILSVSPQSMKNEVQREADMMDDVKTEINFQAFLASFDRFITKSTVKNEANLLQIKTKLLE